MTTLKELSVIYSTSALMEMFEVETWIISLFHMTAGRDESSAAKHYQV